MHQSVWVVAALLAVTMSGCVDESWDQGSGGEPAPGEETEPGEVSVQQQSNGRFIARRTDSASGAFATGDDIRAVTGNGAITIGTGGSSGFAVTARLWAYGDSEQQARDNLEDVRLGMGSGLDAQVTAPSWNNRGGDLIVKVPVADVGDVLAKTTNGAIAIDGLDAATVDADTTNGAISCDVDAPSLELHTSNGAIECAARVRDADISTTNGPIDLELEPTATGTWDIDTTNGLIELLVKEASNIGYDVKGETTNGAVTFDFSDTETVSSQTTFTGASRHERTNGFSSRAIQTTVTLDTSNGAIEAGS